MPASGAKRPGQKQGAAKPGCATAPTCQRCAKPGPKDHEKGATGATGATPRQRDTGRVGGERTRSASRSSLVCLASAAFSAALAALVALFLPLPLAPTLPLAGPGSGPSSSHSSGMPRMARSSCTTRRVLHDSLLLQSAPIGGASVPAAPPPLSGPALLLAASPCCVAPVGSPAACNDNANSMRIFTSAG